MGVVYLGTHSILGRPAAIKVLLPELSQRREIVGRFFNEARAATAIRHPGIVEIYDFGYLPNGSAFIAMEFLEGESLASRLERAGRLSVSATILIGRQIAAALHAAHSKGITHRDLKPDNVFLVPDPEIGERVKLLDFGIAKLTTEEPGGTHTRTGMVMGTPVYMSPEQCRGASTLDSRADLYSLGCMLYELLAGRPVFNADNAGDIIAHHLYFQPEPVRAHEPSVPEPLEQLIHALLAKDPAMRPATAGDVAAVLDQWRSWNVIPGTTTALSIATVSLPHGHPGTHPGGSRGTHPSAPPGMHPGIQPGTHPGAQYGTQPGRNVASVPTTLSGSAMSIAGPPTAAGRSGSKRVLWFVGVAALAAAVGGAVLVTTRDRPAPSAAVQPAPSTGVATSPLPASPPPAVATVAPPEAQHTQPAPAPSPEPERTPPSQAPATETAPPPPNDEAARSAAPAHGEPQPASSDEPRAAVAATPPVTARNKKKNAKHGDPPAKTAAPLAASQTPAPAEPPPPPAPPPPVVAAAPPAPVEPRPEPAVEKPAPPAPTSPGSLDAVSSIASVNVDGPLPDSEIRSTVERALGTFRECYRSAARQASKTPALRVTLSFVIDEGRAARSVRVSGDTLGLGACIKDAASKIRTRVAPDVGTAAVNVVVKFQPTGG
jgi:serine/threonine-protein kinase